MRRRPQSRYDLAILHDPDRGPSRRRTRGRSSDSKTRAEGLGFDVELITEGRLRPRRRVRRAVHPRDDGGQPPHVPLRAPRRRPRAWSSSTIPSRSACTNKVYLAELLHAPQDRVPEDADRPRRATSTRSCRTLGFPCVLKQPDSSFSRGVVEGRDRGAHAQHASGDMLAQVRAGRRAGVPADAISTGASASSTASRSTSASTTWRGATGRSSSATQPARRRRRQLRDARRRRSAEGGHADGAEGRQPDRRRPLRRRPERGRRPAATSSRSTTTRASTPATRTRC